MEKEVTAETLAKQQREISISEFFLKNKHLLGFDNPRKALLTTIKEAVDNSLDACEEARILPNIIVKVEDLQEDRFEVTVEDNGPGIVKEQIPKIFGKLLYGSKFHRLKCSRGQQGIGISASAMYGQLTTGKPIIIVSKTKKDKPTHYYELQIDTKRNEPQIIAEQIVDWEAEHGTKIKIVLEAKYQKGKQSIDEYLEQTAIVNPHLNLIYTNPEKQKIEFPRATNELPKEPKEICDKAGVYERSRPSRIAKQEAENLYKAIQQVKIIAPPTDSVTPIGDELLLRGLKKEINADFYASVTRPPSVYRGNPFIVEASLAYGGDLQKEDSIKLLRFANRVPLQYQQSACAITKSVISTAWRNYGLSQSKGALPIGPVVLLVHIASVWVPFTSESKEAIAHYPEIVKEIK